MNPVVRRTTSALTCLQSQTVTVLTRRVPALNRSISVTYRVKDEHGQYERAHPPRMILARRYIADDDPRAAWASPAAVLDACLDDAPLALADIPAKLPWKVGA